MCTVCCLSSNVRYLLCKLFLFIFYCIKIIIIIISGIRIENLQEKTESDEFDHMQVNLNKIQRLFIEMILRYYSRHPNARVYSNEDKIIEFSHNHFSKLGLENEVLHEKTPLRGEHPLQFSKNRFFSDTSKV